MNNAPAVRVHRGRQVRSGILFALDPEVFRQDASRNLRLTGWALHPGFRVAQVVLGQDGRELAAAEVSGYRPRAAQVHATCPGADRAGFEMSLSPLAPGSYWLAAVSEQGQAERFAEICLVEEDQPRLLFMHIAKAAGSSVNRFLASHYADGSYLLHIESEATWRDDPGSLQKFDLLSGHVGLFALKRRLGEGRYRLLTVVREPMAQLTSHLAWVRRLSDPGEEHRFDRHPEYVQKFSRKLAGLDFTNAADLLQLTASLTDGERQLVDNCQVRYFTRVEDGASVTAEDLVAAQGATAEFYRIGLAEDLEAFLSAIAGDFGWPAPERAARDNVTRDFYGLEGGGPEIRAALQPLLRYDTQLYDFIRRRGSV